MKARIGRILMSIWWLYVAFAAVYGTLYLIKDTWG